MKCRNSKYDHKTLYTALEIGNVKGMCFGYMKLRMETGNVSKRQRIYKDEL